MRICGLILPALLLTGFSLPAFSDYLAGRQAYNAGRYEEAYKLWQEAARRGDAKSLYELGKLYGDGLGVLRNIVHAHAYFNVAAAKGQREAFAARQIVESRMTPEQLAQAEKLALELHSDLTRSAAASSAAKSVSTTGANRKAERPAWKKGYSWNVYVELPNGRKIEKYRNFRGKGKYDGQQLLVMDTEGATIYLTDSLNEKALVRKSKPSTVYDPERHVFDWPLEVAKEWQKPYQVLVGDKITRRPGRFRVEAFEEVKTDAGMFMAFKIIEYGSGGGIRAQEWYAPEVRWIVKKTSRSRKKGKTRIYLKSYDLSE